MSFNVKVLPDAQTAMRSRPHSVQEAIKTILRGDLATRPEEVGAALQEPFVGCRSLSRGGYEIIYRVAGDEVHVLSISQ